jgi:hypothetical protein
VLDCLATGFELFSLIIPIRHLDSLIFNSPQSPEALFSLPLLLLPISIAPEDSHGTCSYIIMPGAKGQDWEKFKKTYADDEIEEKKITPLSAEYAS